MGRHLAILGVLLVLVSRPFSAPAQTTQPAPDLEVDRVEAAIARGEITEAMVLPAREPGHGWTLKFYPDGSASLIDASDERGYVYSRKLDDIDILEYRSLMKYFPLDKLQSREWGVWDQRIQLYIHVAGGRRTEFYYPEGGCSQPHGSGHRTGEKREEAFVRLFNQWLRRDAMRLTGLPADYPLDRKVLFAQDGNDVEQITLHKGELAICLSRSDPQWRIIRYIDSLGRWCAVDTIDNIDALMSEPRIKQEGEPLTIPAGPTVSLRDGMVVEHIPPQP